MIGIANSFWGRFAMGFRDSRHADHFMLWVDGVGGYWVCLGDAILIGQPDKHRTADVPIFGDLSRHHARIRRDGEGFAIEAIGPTSVDGQPVRDFDWLRDGSRIQLGESVRLLFRRPHPLSGTARIEFISHHRTQPSTDAVLWMADTCILGPKQKSHVVCRNWPREVVLYRDAEEFYCRTRGALEIDGVAHEGRITLDSRVQGEGFSFNLEANR